MKRNRKELRTYQRDSLPGVRGADILTWGFVLSQGFGDAALRIWMLENAARAGRQMKKTTTEVTNYKKSRGS